MQTKPRHDDPYRHTAYNQGQDDCLRGKPLNPKYFIDAQRQRLYNDGYHAEHNDCLTVVNL